MLVDGWPDGALSPRYWSENLVCCICGSRILRSHPFNRDHIIPMAKGGPRGKVNKAFAHLLCNSVKGDRFPFSLRTPEEREAVRAWVTARTYNKLLWLWGS